MIHLHSPAKLAAQKLMKFACADEAGRTGPKPIFRRNLRIKQVNFDYFAALFLRNMGFQTCFFGWRRDA